MVTAPNSHCHGCGHRQLADKPNAINTIEDEYKYTSIQFSNSRM